MSNSEKMERTQINIKPMGLGHISEIVEIEELVFPSPWSKQSFIYELVHNDYSFYLVALEGEKVVGYGGMWLVLDEAHITNIAVHPDYQGRKIGGIILEKMISLATSLGVDKMTLEIRVSNERAKNLYEKFDFRPRGLRKGYYTDTKEDAIIMWLDNMQARRRGQ